MTETPTSDERTAALLPWMRGTDPALAWQVERDLMQLPEPDWLATRDRVGREGMAARLIAEQDADGRWAGGAYFPAGFFDDPANADLPGQPWTATTWSLRTLHELGARAADLEHPDTFALLRQNARWEYEDRPYWEGEVDCCINAMTLETALWLGHRLDALADWFPAHQLDDGGWNCEWVEGATVSSVHSTLNSLKGMLAYEQEIATEDPSRATRLRESRHRGEEYLLERRLLFRLRDGEPIGSWVTNATFPLRWRHTALHALSYFRAASLAEGTTPDPRLADAVGALREQQQADGSFRQGRVEPGAVFFPLDVAEGEPSPWVTFLALRVLAWWDAATAPRIPPVPRLG